nr:calcium-binding tyrosine phosphorylation-regulated protein isoform X2 [Manis javanica]
MISPKSRLIIPYGLTTLLEGVSRAILKTNPPNITQFAEVYFKELTVFREENTSLDIQDLVKKFHQTTVERWSERTTQKKKPNGVKELERTSVVSHEPKRLEKSTDTEEDNVTRPQCSDKTTQFPSVHAELLSEPEAAADTARGPKPSTLKITIPPPSPPPLTLSPEFAYVPADPTQFAAQMLGKVASNHSDSSDILMVDVATSMPVLSEEALGSEAEDHAVAAPIACSGKVVGGVMSQTSVHVGLGSEPKDYEGKPPTTSSVPMQDEQEPPAYDQAAKVPLQADIVVTSIVHISSISNNEPVIEVVVSVEQIPQQRAVPFTDHVACPKEHEQSPPVSPILVRDKTASGVSGKSVGSAKLVQFEDTKGDTSVNVEVKGSTTTVCLENSLHLEVPCSPGQESCEHAASRAPEGEPVLLGEAAGAARPAASVRSSGGPPLPVPEMEPEWETAPEPGLMESELSPTLSCDGHNLTSILV